MKKDKIIKICITILLLILPFVDMLKTTSIKDIEILGISVVELVNFILIGISLLFTVIKINKKRIIKLGVYIIILGIYLVLHYQNMLNFDTSIYIHTNYNFLIEAFYIVRVYLLPVLLLFVLYENKDIFNKDYYLKQVKIIIGIFSFSIVILHILKLSFSSYSLDNKFIETNIFSIFNYKGNYKLLSSRGWFDSANQVSAIMFMLFPINIYLLFKEKNRLNIALFIGQFIAMILLGTRTSALGSVLIIIVILFMYIFFRILKSLKKNKDFIKKIIISSTICIIVFFCSPFYFYKTTTPKTTLPKRNETAYLGLENNLDIEEYILKNYDQFKINTAFIEMYPVGNDLDFWLKVSKRDRYLNVDNRKMKIDIIKRVKERNNNYLDTYLGLGYTMDFMDLERDYVYQYYLFGIIGVFIFLIPYFFIIVKNCILILKNIKNKFKFDNLIFLMSPMLILLIAYFSGHVFGWTNPMMYLVFSLGFLEIKVGEKND